MRIPLLIMLIGITCKVCQTSSLTEVDELKRPLKHFSPTYFYHLAIESNLPSIQERGLLCTERLLETTSLTSSERDALLTAHRPKACVLSDGLIIRDQSPMPPKALERVLPDTMTPSDWYRFLNGFVFLWATKDRAERHWHAGKETPQVLLVFDASRLLRDLGDRIYVSPINSGYALRKAAFRSRETFVPYNEWRTKGWSEEKRKTRPSSTCPVEILVKGELPLAPYLVQMEPITETTFSLHKK